MNSGNQRLPEGLRIIEGVMTTLSPGDGGPETRVNIAPMGPLVDTPITRLILRPFNTSTTYRNLKATGQGVFHITDDVLLLARAAIGRVEPGPDLPVTLASVVQGLVLAGACRYHEVRVVELEDHEDRTRIVAQVVHSGEIRPFLGLNRALHAVVEAAILATRVHLTGPAFVLAQYESLQVLVDKTGGDREHEAMRLLRQHVSEWSKAQAT